MGIASIQLAQHVSAKVFATVGTAAKKQFLIDTFRLAKDQIFHSENCDSADQILQASNGRGVDVVLNSITGDMLDESLGILAEGGVMVEIGKKDIPDRNISFRAVDLSAERAPDSLVQSCLAKLSESLNAGHIKPINPIRRFSWADNPSAIRFLRPGTHMGKSFSTTETTARSKFL